MFIEIDGCRIFFDVYGSSLKIEADGIASKPTLIVLHGGLGLADHTLYVEFWSQFSSIAQVVFVDQRGCGRSVCTDKSKWNLNQWADDLHQFCQHLSIKSPIIAGVSAGGHVLCHYVKCHPEAAGGLIFCNTEANFILDDMVEGYRQVGGDSVAAIARQCFTNPTPEIQQQYREKCMVPYYAKNPYTLKEIGRCLHNPELSQSYVENEIHQFDYSEDLKNIQCPVLLLAGADSPFHPPVTAEKMAEKIPAEYLEMHIIKDAGSPVYRDQPQLCYEWVYKFINALTLIYP